MVDDWDDAASRRQIREFDLIQTIGNLVQLV